MTLLPADMQWTQAGLRGPDTAPVPTASSHWQHRPRPDSYAEPQVL